MRKFICQANLLLADIGSGLMAMELHATQDLHNSVSLLISAVWIVCAVKLLRAASLWAWVGSLLTVSTFALFAGSLLLRFLRLLWQGSYGDRTIVMDPTTI